MKNNQFEKAISFFSECLSKESNSIELLYLLGVCTFHLEHYEEVIKYLTAVVSQDDQYRKNVYLFLAIAYKKVLMIDEALQTVIKIVT